VVEKPKQYGEPLVARLLPSLYLKRILDQDSRRLFLLHNSPAQDDRRVDQLRKRMKDV